jgi:ATP-dependent Clp protease ATP-binding subunit ClpA
LPPNAKVIRLGSFLQKYGVDLTKLASEGSIEPAIGRQEVGGLIVYVQHIESQVIVRRSYDGTFVYFLLGN